MKQLSWKLVLPLTIISFTVFTKWWYVEVVDGVDEVLTGFPLPYMCPGWHTSLSLQIFVSALIIDLLTYFALWAGFVFIINRFVKEIHLSKITTYTLLSITALLIAGMLILGSNPDNIYTWKKSFEIEILDTGYEFIWEKSGRPDYYKYRPAAIQD